jgi:hypothetical protein|nr:MAG TPA: hypothetical protein [Caudoviricetes sp.]
MKFIIIDNFRNQQDRDKLVDALHANFGEVVVLSLGELHDFQNLASQLKQEIWNDEVILQRVLVTKIKTEPETEIFQRDLEDSQINILLDYYKQRLKDEFVEIVDLRV